MESSEELKALPRWQRSRVSGSQVAAGRVSPFRPETSCGDRPFALNPADLTEAASLLNSSLVTGMLINQVRRFLSCTTERPQQYRH